MRRLVGTPKHAEQPSPATSHATKAKWHNPVTSSRMVDRLNCNRGSQTGVIRGDDGVVACQQEI